jgi:hypothetical protein
MQSARASVADATGVFTRSLSLFGGRVERVSANPVTTLWWLLRFACAMCFVGHGAWGVITKAGWLPFYRVVGVPEWMAWRSMPVVGAVDIAIGLLALAYPCRALFAWATFWTVFTALLRPAASMAWWEFLERGGNYGPPLALYAIASAQGTARFSLSAPQRLADITVRRVDLILRIAIALLLVGHGGVAAFQQKQVFVDHWQAIGVPMDMALLQLMGAAEMAAGVLVLAWPSRAMLLAIAYWKIVSEALWITSGRAIDTWEWVERGGDYVAPIALMCVALLVHNRSEAGADARASSTSNRRHTAA